MAVLVDTLGTRIVEVDETRQSVLKARATPPRNRLREEADALLVGGGVFMRWVEAPC